MDQGQISLGSSVTLGVLSYSQTGGTLQTDSSSLLEIKILAAQGGQVTILGGFVKIAPGVTSFATLDITGGDLNLSGGELDMKINGEENGACDGIVDDHTISIAIGCSLKVTDISMLGPQPNFTWTILQSPNPINGDFGMKTLPTHVGGPTGLPAGKYTLYYV
jgi:hypothetical protein